MSSPPPPELLPPLPPEPEPVPFADMRTTSAAGNAVEPMIRSALMMAALPRDPTPEAARLGPPPKPPPKYARRAPSVFIAAANLSSAASSGVGAKNERKRLMTANVMLVRKEATASAAMALDRLHSRPAGSTALTGLAPA